MRYNYAVTTRPTQAMWWAEMAIFLAVAAVTFTGISALLVASAPQGRHVTVEGGVSIVLIALSAGVGIFVSGRFRAWGLRRQAVS
ncbi:hypothetical protein ACFYW9_35800 [Streptomyces sp. NPDC002698]|uniref:hypothetical protein n=1 Tax=Streptomyces sp. NPDC002698 TaxID=3364660 RepID=UPI00367EDA3A